MHELLADEKALKVAKKLTEIYLFSVRMASVADWLHTFRLSEI